MTDSGTDTSTDTSRVTGRVTGGHEPRLKDVAAAFAEHFGRSPAGIARAPGRVNLIGEHTDYNDGFVLPMAIEHEVRVAFAPREDRSVRVHALDLGEEATFDLGELAGLAPEDGPRDEAGWVEYPRGVAWALLEDGADLAGMDAVFSGDVPRGAGLSSSAALELAFARAFAAASDLAWEPKRMAKLCQRAENAWVGVQSGIMDQLVSACGRAGNAVLIDCRSLDLESVPLPAGTRIVVLDTSTRRGLVGSAYNERRVQCEQAAEALGVDALRDVDTTTFEAKADHLDETVRRRARHVVTENARTREAALAMRRGDATRLGELMDASHESLREDFEVSSDALDAIVDCARRHPGCFGARMTGAGFGGCAVALVADSDVDSFVGSVALCYRQATGHEARIYVTEPNAGAGLLNPG